jgi:ribosomal protein S12 methylthiotransferase accessory factor
MEIYFPGGKRVYADYKGFTVETDQPLAAGGEGSAPAPFDLFMASIGTCAGIYLLAFLEQRGMAAAGAGVSMSREVDPRTGQVSRIGLDLHLPADFPEKYRGAVVRAVEQCAVKRHLQQPPSFDVRPIVGAARTV